MLNDQSYWSHPYVSSLLPPNSSGPESARSESTSFGGVTAVNNDADKCQPYWETRPSSGRFWVFGSGKLIIPTIGFIADSLTAINHYVGPLEYCAIYWTVAKPATRFRFLEDIF